MTLFSCKFNSNDIRNGAISFHPVDNDLELIPPTMSRWKKKSQPFMDAAGELLSNCKIAKISTFLAPLTVVRTLAGRTRRPSWDATISISIYLHLNAAALCYQCSRFLFHGFFFLSGRYVREACDTEKNRNIQWNNLHLIKLSLIIIFKYFKYQVVSKKSKPIFFQCLRYASW